MAHSNGIIYIDTTTTPHKGVEIADLQQVLGRGTGDLGLLCSDQEWYDNGGTPALRPLNPPRINKWAKYKPSKSAHGPGITTDAMRKAINQDFTPATVHTGGTGGNIEPILYEMSLHGADWEYMNNVLPFHRLLDFVPESLQGNGYNHYAERPFEIIDYNIASSPDPSEWWFQVTWEYKSVDIRLSDLAIFDSLNTGQTWIYGVVYKVGSTTAFCPLYDSAGGTNLIVEPDTTPDTHVGYFTATIGSNQNSIGVALCLAKINASSPEIPLDLIMVPSGTHMQIMIPIPTAYTVAQWMPKVYDGITPAVSIYANQASMLITSIVTRFAVMIGNIASFLNDQFTLTVYIKNSGGSTLASGSASKYGREFEENDGAGKAIFTIQSTPISQQAPFYINDLATYKMSIKLTAGNETTWFTPASAEPLQNMTSGLSESLSTIPDVRNAVTSNGQYEDDFVIIPNN